MKDATATVTVHWPTGPVACCQAHAEGLLRLANFLGSHVGVTPIHEPAVCMNCVNAALKDRKDAKQ